MPARCVPRQEDHEPRTALWMTTSMPPRLLMVSSTMRRQSACLATSYSAHHQHGFRSVTVPVIGAARNVRYRGRAWSVAYALNDRGPCAVSLHRCRDVLGPVGARLVVDGDVAAFLGEQVADDGTQATVHRKKEKRSAAELLLGMAFGRAGENRARRLLDSPMRSGRAKRGKAVP